MADWQKSIFRKVVRPWPCGRPPSDAPATIMFTVLQFVKTQSEMTNGFSWTTSCLSRLLDFCVSLVCVCMAISQNFARCHLLQFRWLLVLSQCLLGFVAGSASNDMFRNFRLKVPCRMALRSVALVARRAWLV